MMYDGTRTAVGGDVGDVRRVVGHGGGGQLGERAPVGGEADKDAARGQCRHRRYTHRPTGHTLDEERRKKERGEGGGSWVRGSKRVSMSASTTSFNIIGKF